MSANPKRYARAVALVWAIWLQHRILTDGKTNNTENK